VKNKTLAGESIMSWWLEYKVGGAGQYHFGDFASAMQKAFDMCISESTVVSVYNGSNEKVAEQTLRGARWVKLSYQGSSCPV
jgi:hypothetical protein